MHLGSATRGARLGWQSSKSRIVSCWAGLAFSYMESIDLTQSLTQRAKPLFIWIGVTFQGSLSMSAPHTYSYYVQHVINPRPAVEGSDASGREGRPRAEREQAGTTRASRPSSGGKEVSSGRR